MSRPPGPVSKRAIRAGCATSGTEPQHSRLGGIFSLSLLVAAVLVCLPAGTSADVIPDSVAACEGAEVGAPCSPQFDERTVGVCQPSTCSRIDYSSPGRHEETYDCLRCVQSDESIDPDTASMGDREKNWAWSYVVILLLSLGAGGWLAYVGKQARGDGST